MGRAIFDEKFYKIPGNLKMPVKYPFHGSDSGGDEMEPRITRLETEVERIKVDLSEIKADIRAIGSNVQSIEKNMAVNMAKLEGMHATLLSEMKSEFKLQSIKMEEQIKLQSVKTSDQIKAAKLQLIGWILGLPSVGFVIYRIYLAINGG